jgi:cytochrome b6-f complex iron-sulfur subunit
MSILASAQSTAAVAVVTALVLLLVVMLGATLARARRAEAGRAATGEGRVAAVAARPAVPAQRGPRPKTVVSRRDFFRGSLLASLGVFAAQFGGASLAFLWPTIRGGFGSTITLTDTPASILDQISSQQQPFYFGAGRFYLINYQGDGVEKGIYTPNLVAKVPGGQLMALYQKCAHLGCRVPFCGQSQWFECPCHGSKYNYAGEYQLGPAPNGLQRFPVTVSAGQIQVNTGAPTAGPPRGTDTIHEPPQGPFCVA